MRLVLAAVCAVMAASSQQRAWHHALHNARRILQASPTPSPTPSPSASAVAASPTGTPSPAASTSPSAGASVSPSGAVTPSGTPSVTSTATGTGTGTASVSRTATPSPTASLSTGASPSNTVSATRTGTPSALPTRSTTPTAAPSVIVVAPTSSPMPPTRVRLPQVITGVAGQLLAGNTGILTSLVVAFSELLLRNYRGAGANGAPPRVFIARIVDLATGVVFNIPRDSAANVQLRRRQLWGSDYSMVADLARLLQAGGSVGSRVEYDIEIPPPTVLTDTGNGVAVTAVQQQQAAAVIGVLANSTAQLDAGMAPILSTIATTFSIPASSLGSSVDTSAAVVTITNPRQPDDGPGLLSGGAIAGIVIGVVVAATLIVVAIAMKTRRGRKAVGQGEPGTAAPPLTDPADMPPPRGGDDGMEMV